MTGIPSPGGGHPPGSAIQGGESPIAEVAAPRPLSRELKVALAAVYSASEAFELLINRVELEAGAPPELGGNPEVLEEMQRLHWQVHRFACLIINRLPGVLSGAR